MESVKVICRRQGKEHIYKGRFIKAVYLNVPLYNLRSFPGKCAGWVGLGDGCRWAMFVWLISHLSAGGASGRNCSAGLSTLLITGDYRFAF